MSENWTQLSKRILYAYASLGSDTKYHLIRQVGPGGTFDQVALTTKEARAFAAELEADDDSNAG